MNEIRYVIVGISLAVSLVLNSAYALDDPAQSHREEPLSTPGLCKNQIHGELFHKTELFFGLSRSNGPDVTEQQFQNFVDSEVTPRFPDGLILLTGTGQFKGSNGTIIQEGSKLLILLYPFNPNSSLEVEKIREAYKVDFQQESVLRVDEQSCVSF